MQRMCPYIFCTIFLKIHLYSHSGEKPNKRMQCDFVIKSRCLAKQDLVPSVRKLLRKWRCDRRYIKAKKRFECELSLWGNWRLCSCVPSSKSWSQTKSKLWCLELFAPSMAIMCIFKVHSTWYIFHTWRIEKTFENTQWQKMSQMQSVWLCIWSANVLRAHLRITHWRKIKKMQPVWLWIVSGGQFVNTFENAQWSESNKCDQCDYASSYASVLKTHLKMHSGEKPNKWNQCDHPHPLSKLEDLISHPKYFFLAKARSQYKVLKFWSSCLKHGFNISSCDPK